MKIIYRVKLFLEVSVLADSREEAKEILSTTINSPWLQGKAKVGAYRAHARDQGEAERAKVINPEPVKQLEQP